MIILKWGFKKQNVQKWVTTLTDKVLILFPSRNAVSGAPVVRPMFGRSPDWVGFNNRGTTTTTTDVFVVVVAIVCYHCAPFPHLNCLNQKMTSSRRNLNSSLPWLQKFKSHATFPHYLCRTKECVTSLLKRGPMRLLFSPGPFTSAST